MNSVYDNREIISEIIELQKKCDEFIDKKTKEIGIDLKKPEDLKLSDSDNDVINEINGLLKELSVNSRKCFNGDDKTLEILHIIYNINELLYINDFYEPEE